jgi:hypothetical protein
MPRTNEAIDTDLKAIERLQQAGWKQGQLFFNKEFIIKIKCTSIAMRAKKDGSEFVIRTRN